MKFVPKYEKNFKPAYLELIKFFKTCDKTLHIAIERNNDLTYRKDIPISDDFETSYFYVERIIKSILWIVGGYKIYVDNKKYYERLKVDYSMKGTRSFDCVFMSKVYENDFEVIYSSLAEMPKESSESLKIGGFSDGCRIGFDAGGSDRKVCAVKDGEVVYSEEVIWFPKENKDPNYHYEEIKKAFKTAADKLPRVDAIGVSSAGIYIDNNVRVASLFLKVKDDDFNKKIKTIYKDIASIYGNIPLGVANDGDVASLAGAIELNDTEVLGIAMGTSEAAGYINTDGGINGWLNELAFVPVDFSSEAMIDEWSLDYGCGVKYFSQDGVIKLANNAGLHLCGTPAEKLLQVQEMCEKNDEIALQIFKDIGVCFGYSLAYYSMFYDLKYVLILGRVTSGIGGSKIIEFANKVLKYLHLDIKLVTPDEKNKRLGQAFVASTLPKID